jgi:hypothetical protein
MVEGGGSRNGRRIRMRSKVIKFMSEDEKKARNLKIKRENEKNAQANALIVKKSHMGCQTSC